MGGGDGATSVSGSISAFGNSVDGVTPAELELVLVDVSLRMPKTENAVEKSVKKKPATMTAAILRSSTEDPKDCAKGRVTKEGTKKTGNHFAKTAAPGANNEYILSPIPVPVE